MNRIQRTSLLGIALSLAGCGEGAWEVEIWGEDYIEEGIPEAAFADGCAARFDTFLITLAQARLVDGDGAAAAQLEGPQLFDLTLVGPHEVGSWPARSGLYDTAVFEVAPAQALSPGNATAAQVEEMTDAGASVRVRGSLTCGAETVTFDWAFPTATTYTCEPEALSLPRGGSDGTELTIHGDHLFYDGLEDPDAEVRGEAILAADADGDGAVTLAELDAVPVAPLGYTVGRYSEVTTLAEFVSHLTQTLGHVDGEGHCGVAF